VRARQGVTALAPVGEGILAVLQDQATLDRLQGVIRELQLEDELVVTDTLDAALRRIRTGQTPRLLVLDLADLPAPITEVGAARAVGGPDLEVLALGSVNDVTLYRDLLSAGATDYLIKPPSREALAAILEKKRTATGADGKPGQLIAFFGSRGGVGTTTAAVACAWMLAEKHKLGTGLLDLDLHFGTVALKLDADPGSGLCEAIEQPSRIDSLFIERAMIKVSDRLWVLAAETSVAQHLIVDGGAIDMLLYELRRKFPCVVVDLPRGASPMHRVVLEAATHVVVLCERTLAGLRDTIRVQSLVREQIPQTRLWLVEAGSAAERALIGRGEFEKGLGRPLDARLPYDPKSAGAAANAGQPLPRASPRSPLVRELGQLTAKLAGPTPAAGKRRLFTLPSLW
jgi:pilus assembly protein CpaE